MRNQDLVEAFNREVDQMVADTFDEDSVRSSELEETLALAKSMATDDYGDELGELKTKVRQNVFGKTTPSRKIHVQPMPWRMLRMPVFVMVVILGLVAVLATISLVWPGSLSALAQTFEDSIHQIVVGEHTVVESRTDDDQEIDDDWVPPEKLQGGRDWMVWEAFDYEEPGPDGEVWDDPEDFYLLYTSIGGFGVYVPEGEDPFVFVFSDLDSAEAHLGSPIAHLGVLPDGYDYAETLVFPDGGHVLSFYQSSTDYILLTQTMFGEVTVSINDTIEEVDLLGQPAAWMPAGLGLIWEGDDEIPRSLGGTDLELEQAVELFESLSCGTF